MCLSRPQASLPFWVRCPLSCGTVLEKEGDFAIRSLPIKPRAPSFVFSLSQRRLGTRQYMCSASRKCTALFHGFAIISRYKVTYWAPKMTRKNIESSSWPKEGCLQSIELLKAQSASRQWVLTSGGHPRDHLEAEVLHNANVLHNVFMNTTVMYCTCLCVSIYSFKFKAHQNL